MIVLRFEGIMNSGKSFLFYEIINLNKTYLNYRDYRYIIRLHYYKTP